MANGFFECAELAGKTVQTHQTRDLCLLGVTPESKFFRFMAGTTGLEPATSAVTGQRSNQLSYVPLQNSNARLNRG